MRVAEPRITWTFRGPDLTLDDYLSRNPTTGLLIARDDTIFVERYQYGRTDRHHFTSWSMAKTVTAMLIGIAIDEGRIRSVVDLAAVYVPALSGTEYGTSLRHLLQMRRRGSSSVSSSGGRSRHVTRSGELGDSTNVHVADLLNRLPNAGLKHLLDSVH